MKVELGKEYENSRSDYRIITPLEACCGGASYRCDIMTFDEDDNEIHEEAYLTAHDILNGN